MAHNSDGQVLPKPLTLTKFIRELVEALDKHGDLVVVTPNTETSRWADVEDVTVKDGKVRIMFDMMPPDLEDHTPESRIHEDDAWGSVWLHGDWKWLTRNMSSEAREVAANALVRWMHTLDEADGVPPRREPDTVRWWNN